MSKINLGSFICDFCNEKIIFSSNITNQYGEFVPPDKDICKKCLEKKERFAP